MPQTSPVMEIPVSVLQKWSERHSRGDERRIHESMKLSRPTISKALNHGLGTTETILKISRFYAKKKALFPHDIETAALKILNNETLQS